MSVSVNTYEAKNRLSELMHRAEHGEDVILTRRGQPIVRLVACTSPNKMRFGTLKGKIVVHSDIVSSDSEVTAMFDESVQ